MRYRAYYRTHIEITVEVEADNEDDAAEISWDMADEYTHTIYGKPFQDFPITAEVSLDGIGADVVVELPPDPPA